ncbi:MAG: hypothetical protein ACP5DZ_01355 [Bacteroidales bacterium]
MIKTNAEIHIKGHVTGVGTSGGITNNGTLKLTGNWTNNVFSSFLTGTSEVVFNASSSSQTIGGSSTTSFHDLTVANSSDGVLLAQNIFVDNELKMSSGDLDLQFSVVDLGTTGSIINESENSRIKVGDINNHPGTIKATRTINNVTDLNPGNLGVLITTPYNLCDITVVRGHYVQQGTGFYTGNSSVARYIKIHGIDKLGSVVNVEMYYWEDESYSTVQLEWKMASEDNVDYYEIQRTVDTNWETIKTTDAAGVITQTIKYTNYDESPPADADIIYYRLKQVDFDGNYKYSDIDAVLAPDNAIEIISIYPNPAGDKITVEIESIENTRIYIYVWDKLGKTVILKQAEVMKGKNEYSL